LSSVVPLQRPQLPGVATLLAMAALPAMLGLSTQAVHAATASARPQPGVGHVFIVMLENEGYNATFGWRSPAGFLKQLRRQGAEVRNYYGIGHFSLDNYIALISGQAPNPATGQDCTQFTEFIATGVTSDGQAIGNGCVYPASVATIADQLQAKGLSWKAYMQDMGNDPARGAG
jgi:phosphatidylinositol-3-phosphatase